MNGKMTKHAKDRSRGRMISILAIEAAQLYGTCRSRKDALIYTIGVREVNKAFQEGVDIQYYRNVEVIEGYDGNIITVYRNKKRGSLQRYSKSERYKHISYNIA